jgi:hypothetical protein
MNIESLIPTAIVVAAVIMAIIISRKKRPKEKYRYYTIKVYRGIPEEGTRQYFPLPEPELGPNLRQSIKSKKWQIGRVHTSYLAGEYDYRWRTISKKSGQEILQSIEKGQSVEVLFKNQELSIVTV